MNACPFTIQKPSFSTVPIAGGLRWRGGAGWRYEEKLDGRWHVRQVGADLLAGELMRGGAFYAFDVLTHGGEDVRPYPLRERLAILDTLPVLRPAVGTGGEFLEAVLARGGEGCVAKALAAPFGQGLYKCKRRETHFCRVADLDPWTGTAILADRDTGEQRGRVALRNRFGRARVGSILKLECFGLTARGLLREARLDNDTPQGWLVQF